jgi:DNA replication protein DnaC
VGKSHIATALGHLACRRGYEVSFLSCSHLLADLAGGHADRSFPARLKCLSRPAMFVIDDWAMRAFSALHADDVYELICERAGRSGRCLVLTSNRSPSDWYALFPNAVVGESVLDGVINSSYHLLLDGKSYRPTRHPARRS